MSLPTLSILDLSPIVEGGDVGQALRRSRRLAQQAERQGFRRFWMAEHHGNPGVASAATSVAIGFVAEGTSSIRVGSGGIMLPNHAPLQIAEQFGALESLYPGRIDLGVGRAPGTDQMTARALRRTLNAEIDRFPNDVVELISYFQPPAEGQRVLAIPGAGLKVPVYILGSSTYGAQLAAMLGLPFAFASHFSPQGMETAVEIYRSRFQPSGMLDKPYVMLGMHIVAADTQEEAEFIATSHQINFIRMITGSPGPLPPPQHDVELNVPAAALPELQAFKAREVVGDKAQVRAVMEDFVARTQADELIVAAQIYDEAANLRSFEIVGELMAEGAAPRPVSASAAP